MKCGVHPKIACSILIFLIVSRRHCTSLTATFAEPEIVNIEILHFIIHEFNPIPTVVTARFMKIEDPKI